jgi:hypothetical protein
MATLHVHGNGDSGQRYVPKEAIIKTLDSLTDVLQKVCIILVVDHEMANSMNISK